MTPWEQDVKEGYGNQEIRSENRSLAAKKNKAEPSREIGTGNSTSNYYLLFQL